VLLLLVLSAATLGAQGKGVGMLDALESQSQQERIAASAEIIRRRQIENAQIAQIAAKYVQVEERKGSAKDNLVLLGRLHAAETIPLLVQNMTFAVFYKDTKRPQSVEDLYPAVQALIHIGSPSLNPVLERLKNEDGETLQRTGAAVFRGVLGRVWATCVLENEIKAAGQTKAVERLRQVLRHMSELP